MTDTQQDQIVIPVIAGPAGSNFAARRSSEYRVDLHTLCKALLRRSSTKSYVSDRFLKQNSLGGSQGDGRFPASLYIRHPGPYNEPSNSFKFIPDPDNGNKPRFIFLQYSNDWESTEYDIIMGNDVLSWMDTFLDWDWFPFVSEPTQYPPAIKVIS